LKATYLFNHVCGCFARLETSNGARFRIDRVVPTDKVKSPPNGSKTEKSFDPTKGPFQRKRLHGVRRLQNARTHPQIRSMAFNGLTFVNVPNVLGQKTGWAAPHSPRFSLQFRSHRGRGTKP